VPFCFVSFCATGLKEECEVSSKHAYDNRHPNNPGENLIVPFPVFAKHPKHTHTLTYMREFKKRQPTGAVILRFFALCVGTLLLFLLSVVGVRAAWGMYDTFKVAVDARDSAEGELASLTATQTRLSATVDSFQTPEGIEHEMRERFGVARPGEGEIQIVRDQSSTTVEQGNKEEGFLHVLHSFFLW
jgi:cell division protein FtsB